MKNRYLLVCLFFCCFQGFSQNELIQLNALTEINKGAKLEVADFDGDGDVEFVTVHSTGLLYYENEGLGTDSWSPNIFPFSSTTYPLNLKKVDLDNDGDWDVFFTAEDILVLFLNDGEGFFEVLEFENEYVTLFSREVGCGDMDGDGDVDIVSACDSEIVWIENIDNWTQTETHVITLTVDTVGFRGAMVVDWNQDGVNEFIAFQASYADENRLYSSDGEGGYDFQPIPGFTGGVYDYDIQDIDDDGVLELGFGTSIGMLFMELGGSEIEIVEYEENYPDGGHFFDIDNDGAFEWIQLGWPFGTVVYVDFDENGQPLGWNEAAFSIPAAHDLYVMDADENGQPDLIYSSHHGSPTMGAIANFSLTGVNAIPTVGQTTLEIHLSQNGFWIENHLNQPMQIEVFTVDGKKVHDANHVSLEIIPTSNWNTGIYLVKVNGQFLDKLWVE